MSLSSPSVKSVSYDDLRQVLPQHSLFGKGALEGKPEGVGWLLSPQPYRLTVQQHQTLLQLGPCLYQFSIALDQLYKLSLKQPEFAWVQHLMHRGKPESLIQFSHMNRFKSHLPLVIRPDLLVTTKGFTLCEIDAVPGGLGFTGALHQAYQSLGFPMIGTPEGLPKVFLDMLFASAAHKTKEPAIAVIVSDEAEDYRDEMAWLVEQVRLDYPHIALLHPRQITLEHDLLGWRDDSGRFSKIDLIYRFFELFDLPNIPQIELIQYALKKGLVMCTPPFKPHLEEKLALALLYSPSLEDYWLASLGDINMALLKSIVPESWILDPSPVPPHAQVSPELRLQDKRLRDFSGLSQLTQKQRALVIKPSGFSPLAWGSRGVKIGHDLSQTNWSEALTQAFSVFSTTPHIMQRFENTLLEPYTYFDPVSHDIIEAQGRTRLCPYYFVQDGQAALVSILATTCPKDKKIIHGMRDGVMRPAYLPSGLGENQT